MKLYTKPRPLYVWQLRPGDQVATLKKGGDLISTETAYVDEDLANRVRWSVVHDLTDRPMPRSDNPAVLTEGTRVRHTFGEHDRPNSLTVITREVIEIDPWTYIQQPK